MKRIFTVQHTQSEHHINGMVGSWTDCDLTETGKKQAARTAEKPELRETDDQANQRQFLYGTALWR